MFIQDGASSCTKYALMVKTKRHSKVILDFDYLKARTNRTIIQVGRPTDVMLNIPMQTTLYT